MLDTPSSIAAPPEPVADLPLRGSLELRNVGFNYPHADGRSSTTSRSGSRPGQTLAIVGSTGAGKTTLINLAPRLYDATGG